MRLCWTSCVMTQLFVLGTEQYRSSKSVLPELVEGGVRLRQAQPEWF